jgi:hypothetical protein
MFFITQLLLSFAYRYFSYDRALLDDEATAVREGIARRRIKFDLESLAEEDIDEQDIHVHLSSTGKLFDEDLLSFINVYFPSEFMAQESYHVKHTTNPEINRNGMFLFVFVLKVMLSA